MEYVRGESLGSAWEHLSTSERDAIFSDIKHHLGSLRELEPPRRGVVSSALQNPAFDCRIGFRFFGPLSHADFHSLTRGHLVWEDVAPFLGEQVAKVHTGSYKTHFTHADLAPRNIMVRRGRVVAIVDWGYAGWYPEYWEFTKANYTYFRDESWEEFLCSALPGYETELAAERVLWRVLPEPGTKRTSTSREGVQHKHPGSSPSETWLKSRRSSNLSDMWSIALPWRYEGS